MAILSLTMKRSIWLFSMNWARVYKTRYFLNSWEVKRRPLVAKLQMARLNTFRVKSSSIKEQFSRRELFSVPIMLYLLTNLPCLEKFSQMTERMAKMSLRREELWSSSQSMRKTVTKNLRVKGKQNLGFSRMSSAMSDSVQSMRNQMFWSWASSFQDRDKCTQRRRPRRVKWFIIFRMRSTQVMKTEVYPFWKRWLTPNRQCSKRSPSATRITSASCDIALAASVSSVACFIDQMRNSNGGFSRMMGKQEGQDQLDPDEAMMLERKRCKQNQKIIIRNHRKLFFYLLTTGEKLYYLFNQWRTNGGYLHFKQENIIQGEMGAQIFRYRQDIINIISMYMLNLPPIMSAENEETQIKFIYLDNKQIQ